VTVRTYAAQVVVTVRTYAAQVVTVRTSAAQVVVTVRISAAPMATGVPEAIATAVKATARVPTAAMRKPKFTQAAFGPLFLCVQLLLNSTVC